MADPSEKFLAKIDLWLHNGLNIEYQAMSPEQRFRATLCLEAYHRWLQDKQINARTLLGNLARREYMMIVQRANSGDEKAVELMRALHICADGKGGITQRSLTEITNDVKTLNHIISVFTVNDTDMERAKVLDASDWLIREGMKHNDARAVKSGIDTKMTLHNNFHEQEDVASQMPSGQMNITDDPGVVKRGRTKLSPEEEEALRRKYGVSVRDYAELVEQEDGTWAIPEEGASEPEEEDVFVQHQPSVHDRELHI